MRRRLVFRPATPKGPPPASVVPTALGEDGSVICPRCGGLCCTPTHWNPWTGNEDVMILVGNKTARCPHCRVVQFIRPELAKEYNRRIYTTNPECWEGD